MKRLKAGCDLFFNLLPRLPEKQSSRVAKSVQYILHCSSESLLYISVNLSASISAKKAS